MNPHPLENWQRGDDEIARRIESSEVKRSWGTRPFIIQEGVKALLFSQGRLVGEQAAGPLDVDGWIRKLIVGDTPTWLVLADAGHITMQIPLSGLSSAEGVEIEVAVRFSLQLMDPIRLYSNGIKDAERLLKSDLSSSLRPTLASTAAAFTKARPIADLIAGSAWHDDLKVRLREAMEPNTTELGFVIVSIETPTLAAARFEQVRRQDADAFIEELSMKAAARLFGAQVRDKQDRTTTEATVAEALRQALHELAMRDLIRAREFEGMKAIAEEELTDRRARAALDRDKEDHEHGLSKRKAELDTLLDVRERNLTQQHQRELNRAEVLGKRVDALHGKDVIAVLGAGAEHAVHIAAIEQKRLDVQQAQFQSNLQAQVASARYEETQKIVKHLLDQPAQVQAEFSKLYQLALQTSAQVATARAAAQGPGQQTVVTGGIGQPTIINPTPRPS